MEKEILEKYNKAKEVSDKVKEFAKSLVKSEEKILNIAERVEEKIRELGAKPAFPLNVSINEIAAHYTPDIDDDTTLKEGDLVKIDVGTQVDGYIWDCAFTVCVGEKTHPLIEASEKALQEALKLIKPGIKVCEISEVVEETILSYGFNPVRNLCGHGLSRYNQHDLPTIPNGKNNIQTEIEEDQVIAMEVFVTDGVGLVKESFPVLIYKFKQQKPVRLPEARKILSMAANEFDYLPFAKRWLAGKIPRIKIDFALRELIEVDALIDYPILKEESNRPIAQTEETIIVK